MILNVQSDYNCKKVQFLKVNANAWIHMRAQTWCPVLSSCNDITGNALCEVCWNEECRGIEIQFNAMNNVMYTSNLISYPRQLRTSDSQNLVEQVQNSLLREIKILYPGVSRLSGNGWASDPKLNIRVAGGSISIEQRKIELKLWSISGRSCHRAL